jgi:hypothetical protein
MYFTQLLLVSLTTAGLLEAASTGYHHPMLRRQSGNLNGTGTNNNNNKSDESTCLTKDVLQTGSQFTGQEEGTEGIKAGQEPSQT